MSDALVHLVVENGVATVTMDSPANRNALSQRMMSELSAQVEAALADPKVRVLVLTGTGTVFCAGADLKEQREGNTSKGVTGANALVPTLKAIWRSPKPVVCRVNGAARAGGLGLIAACDLAVGVEGATFGLSEVRIGVAPAIISVVLLPKLGLTTATELFLTGEPFDAKRAVEIGLLTAAAPAERLDEVVGGYVSSLLKGAPRAMANAKRIIREVPSMGMDEAFAEMEKQSAAFFASEEALEGMTAFAEKRPPSWQVS